MNDSQIFSMHKILALDPDAIESAEDWYRVYPFLGQAKGLFMANYPKKWISKFLKLDVDANEFSFWDQERIKQFLISLDASYSFISLNAPYDNNIDWASNYHKIGNKDVNCIAFGRRGKASGLKEIDQLDPRQLFIDTTVMKKFTPAGLARILSIFMRNSGKIAIVDRHNYLTKINGEVSPFVEFIREVLKDVKSSKCYEILIYAKYDPDKYSYMTSSVSLYEKLSEVFSGFVTPLYGITYICCAEYLNSNDLHARKILTNHAAFALSDSIAGKTYSQSVTRIHDQEYRNINLKAWIDGEHGLDVKLSANLTNHIGAY